MKKLEQNIIDLIDGNSVSDNKIELIRISEKNSILIIELNCDKLTLDNTTEAAKQFTYLFGKNQINYCYYMLDLSRLCSFDYSGLIFLIAVLNELHKPDKLLDIIVKDANVKLFFSKTDFFSKFDFKETV